MSSEAQGGSVTENDQAHDSVAPRSPWASSLRKTQALNRSVCPGLCSAHLHLPAISRKPECSGPFAYQY